MSTHFDSNKTFTALASAYNLVDTLTAGTSAMKAAGILYLPREPAEAPQNYQIRLNRSILNPIYSRTVKTAVGKAFIKPMSVTLPVGTEFLDINVDGNGSSIERFTKELLTDAINYGITYLMVDYPVTNPNGTLADERSAGALPYWVNIKPTQVCDISTGYINGTIKLTYFRFLEIVDEIDNEGIMSTVEQAKEFIALQDNTVMYNIYRKDNTDKEYLYDTNILIGVDIIPIIPVYGNKVSNYHGSPVLLDLAQMNVTHWQMYSDYLNIIHSAQVPMLLIKGYQPITNEDGSVEEIIISPNSAIKLADPTGDVKWIEVTGGGISAGKIAIDDLEIKMSLNGLELTIPSYSSNQPETATGRIIDAAIASSMLKGIIIDVQHAIGQAIVLSCAYVGVTPTGLDVNISTDFAVTIEYQDIVALYQAGLITSTEASQEIKARGIVSTLGNATTTATND